MITNIKKWKCPFCIKQLDLKNKYTKSGHLARCIAWKKYKEDILTKEYLENEYINKGRSALEISQEHNLGSAIAIINRIKYFNIKTRNSSDAKLQLKCKEKYENTCLERYGEINALSKGTVPFKKRNETVKERYGVDNVFQLESVINKIADDNYWLEKYGVNRSQYLSQLKKNTWKKLSYEEKIEWLKKSLWKYPKNWISKLEDRIYEIISKLNSPITRQFCIKKYHYDFLLGKKLIIEVNGDYWHANPRKYKKDDILHFPNNYFVKAEKLWNRDKKKKIFAEKNGYKLIYIWEDEIVKHSDKEVVDLLFNKIKENCYEN